MTTKFECKCGNNDPQKTKFYEGTLGFDAIVCTECARYHSYTGQHDADSWSRQFVGLPEQTTPTTNETNKPLYQVINEQRTQGKWDMFPFSKNCLTIQSDKWRQDKRGNYICEIIQKRDAGDLNDEDKINAQYIALAVNNLAEIAAILEDIANTKVESVLDAALMKVKAKEALKKIS